LLEREKTLRKIRNQKKNQESHSLEAVLLEGIESEVISGIPTLALF